MTATSGQSCVAEALSEFEKGFTKNFDVLSGRIKDEQLDDEELIQILKGLQECLGDLGRDKETLVGVVLNIGWTHRDRKVTQQYKSFVLSLLSAHTFYLRAVLRMIVKGFLPPPGSLVGHPPDASEEDKVSHTKTFFQLHMLLTRILEMVPMSPMVLMPLLSDIFPYHTRPGYLQQCYTRNLLQLSIYLSSHRVQILEIVFDKMTKLDVLSPRNDIVKEVESDSEEEDMDIFQMDGVLPSSVEKQTKEAMTHVEASKLDLLMEEMFHHVKDICYASESIDWSATKDLYMDLLRVFDKIILPTHDCGHVQYIMFYICSLKDVLCESFLDYLWKKVQNPSTQPIFRQAAVAYIESLVARANFVPTSTVKHVLEILVPWVHNYIRETAEINTKANVKLHGPFYSVCQAVFYILVFRHKDLVAFTGGLKFCQGLNIQTIITCRLNPLRFCLPTVVTKFASVARQHQMAFCDTVIEKNKRSLLPEMSMQHGKLSHLTNLNPLDSYFPFDPYILKNSAKFIEPLYREYDSNVEDGEEPQATQEEDDYMDVGSLTDTQSQKIFEIALSTSAKSPISPNCTDLLMLGTSPGFKQM